MIEQDFARIAAALERIANHLEGHNNRPAIALAPVEATVISAPAPTRGRPRKVAPAEVVADPTPPPETLPESEPAPTLDTLRARLREVSAQGQARREAALALLGAYGVARITDLPENLYPAFAERLSQLESLQ
jgi:hypothetical protein